MNHLEAVLTSLNYVVLLRNQDKSFTLLNPCANWFSELYFDQTATTFDANLIDLCLAFPFIENFIIDADSVWCKPKSKESISSGVWTESNADGEEVQLTAIASNNNGCNLLIIENRTEHFKVEQDMMQKARDIALLNEKLVTELNHRQRNLQSDIAQLFDENASMKIIGDAIKSEPAAVIIFNSKSKVLNINNEFKKLFQIEDIASSQPLALLERWCSEAEPIYPEMNRVLTAGSYWEGEFSTRTIQEQKHFVRLNIAPIKNERQQVTHFVCIIHDISNLRLDEKHDSSNYTGFEYTTQLPNRRYFWRKIQERDKASRKNKTTYSVLYIDLDYFKRINDKFGFEQGDNVLKLIGSRISRCVKQKDFVSHLGGDEFTIIAFGAAEQLKPMSDRLRRSISEPVLLDETSVSITASIGIATIEDSISLVEVVKHSDLAMSSAKELGRNQCRIYTEQLDLTFSLRLQREHDIHDAIKNDDFHLLYQPKTNVNASDEFNVEALVRWEHNTEGTIYPNDFIPIAEDSGQIIPLGRWVLEQACNDAKTLLDKGINIRMAVNVSTKQLKHPDFFNHVVKALEKSGLPSENLELEITESGLLADIDSILDVLHQIRQLGVTVALDDFGTGFSSLNYLRQMPVDFIKIDKEFVDELPANNQSMLITTSLIELAHSLNLKVIAEGVETLKQLKCLTSVNCDYIQGYYFYKPLPFKQLELAYKTETEEKRIVKSSP
ncbi:sensor domain-containing protein [Vibrio penaeicida]|uniref:sensor domain-containing protein n=1 Tax=Vibrio penaeicida TaxID=104609 RepID=UPI000CE9C927|nr:EAL domain-containing protein [Vibrio penaeicida]